MQSANAATKQTSIVREGINRNDKGTNDMQQHHKPCRTQQSMCASKTKFQNFTKMCSGRVLHEWDPQNGN